MEKKFGNDVRLVYVNNPLPFHQYSMGAAMAGECAKEQGRFWQMHDLMFKSSPQLDSATLMADAKKAGLNVAKWKKCTADNKYKGAIAADQEKAARFGARGTPAFFINGRFLSGAQPYPNFERLVQEELNKAKASGIPKSQYYSKAVLEKGLKKV